MAETTAPSKPLFRKVTKSKKHKAQSRIREREEEEEEEETEATTEAIQSTKKKRKLLKTVLYKRGLDSRVTLQANKEAEVPVETKAKPKTTDPDRLRAFSGGTGSTDDGSEGVLQRKHKQALEEFIQQNLVKDDVKPQAEEETPKSDVNDLETKLYQELASSAAQLSGSATDGDKETAEDVGSGGAMLGGTGLAEVLLPVDTRMETVRATEEARMKRQQLKGAGVSSSAVDMSMLPTSFSIGKGKKERRQRAIQATKGDEQEPDSVPVSTSKQTSRQIVSELPASYSQNFSLQSQERRKQAELATRAAESSTANVAIGADTGRIGFEAARRFDMDPSESGDGSSSAQPSNQASDARVFRNFVKSQRERGF